MSTAIKVENLSKIYRLGEIGTGTISQDLERWVKMNVLGKEDPFLKIGESNDRSQRGSSDLVYSLQDLNFEIQQGDAVGIIGRNGAGKSTLLKILSRVTSPTTGKININGRVASLLEVGTGFHPELTGRENIFLNGAILGMRKREIDRKFDEIVDFSGIERYIDTPVKRYSSGMYVRLAFAVAAHLESEILIVDEVLAVGDAEFQKKCLGKMGDVSKGEGRTVLFVSHNMGSVQKICNNGILLQNGVVKLSGSTENVLREYLINNQRKSTFKIDGILDFQYFIQEGAVDIIKNGKDTVCKVDCVVISKKNTSELCIDLTLKDNRNQELAFGSLGGLYFTKILFLKEGKNRISFFFPVDNFANGSYSISLDLAQPKIQYLHRLDDCLDFELLRSNDDQIRVLDQNWGSGSIQINLEQIL